MKFTYDHAYNFNISTIQNKSRKNIKVIFIYTYGIHSYEYEYSGQKYFCGNHTLTISSTGIALTTKLSLVCESNTLFW